MQAITVTYQIDRADYCESNAVLMSHVLPRVRWETWGLWAAAVLLLFMPLTYRNTCDDWIYPVVVIPFAIAPVYIGLMYFSPRFTAWLSYRSTCLANESFTATFSSERVTVQGKHTTWEFDWQAFKLVVNSRRIFFFFDGTVMFIFAKRYFAPEQVDALRNLIQECWKPGAPEMK
jgi:hypothetical protein